MTKIAKSVRLVELEAKLEKIQDIILNSLEKSMNFPEKIEPQHEYMKEMFLMYRDVKTAISECEI